MPITYQLSWILHVKLHVAFVCHNVYLQQAQNDPKQCAAVMMSNLQRGRRSPFWRYPLADAHNVPEMPVTVSGLNCIIVVQRFTTRWVLSAVFPIMATTWLGFLVFFLPRDDMNGRLGSIVALFLALAAIQFVVDSDVPNSSYITPLQQLTLASYLSLILVGAECCLIWYLTTYHVEKNRSRRHMEAKLNYEAKLAAVRTALDAWLAKAQGGFTSPGSAASSTAAAAGSSSNRSGLRLRSRVSKGSKILDRIFAKSQTGSAVGNLQSLPGVGPKVTQGVERSGPVVTTGDSDLGPVLTQADNYTLTAVSPSVVANGIHTAAAAAAAAAAVSPAGSDQTAGTPTDTAGPSRTTSLVTPVDLDGTSGEVRLLVSPEVPDASGQNTAAAAAAAAAAAPAKPSSSGSSKPQQHLHAQSLLLADAAAAAAMAAAELSSTQSAAAAANTTQHRGGILRFMRKPSSSRTSTAAATAAAAAAEQWNHVSAAAAAVAAAAASDNHNIAQTVPALPAANGSSPLAAAAVQGCNPSTRSAGGATHIGQVVQDLLAVQGKDLGRLSSAAGHTATAAAAAGDQHDSSTPDDNKLHIHVWCHRLHMYFDTIGSDEAFADRMAHQANKWCALVQFVLYNIAAILVFAINARLYRIV